jgi:hypothetical protein
LNPYTGEIYFNGTNLNNNEFIKGYTFILTFDQQNLRETIIDFDNHVNNLKHYLMFVRLVMLIIQEDFILNHQLEVLEQVFQEVIKF